MGILDGLFAKPKPSADDRPWFKGYEDSDWVSINNFLDVSSDSCYKDERGNAFCIIRGINRDKASDVMYFGCMVAPSKHDEIGVIVLRRDENGDDEWHNGAYTLQNNIQGISEATGLIRNIASFNAYSAEPKYVFFMLLMNK